jgi:hypothetical protein
LLLTALLLLALELLLLLLALELLLLLLALEPVLLLLALLLLPPLQPLLLLLVLLLLPSRLLFWTSLRSVRRTTWQPGQGLSLRCRYRVFLLLRLKLRGRLTRQARTRLLNGGRLPLHRGG